MSFVRGSVAAFCSLALAAAGCSGNPPASSAAPKTIAHAVASAPPESPARFADVAPPVARLSTIPVLLFHQVCPIACGEGDTYGMTHAELEKTLVMLRAEGFTTITTAEYVRFLRDEPNAVPSRPILITFDDGRLDAYVGADDLLRVMGMRATMFAITGKAQERSSFHMQWSDFAAAQASGRWDIQLHANEGHSHIAASNGGRGIAAVQKAPFYANRRFDPVAYHDAGHLEGHDAWKTRVEDDIREGIALLTANVPGYVPRAFAVPFGDYGQKGSNDATIADAFRASLDRRFDAWFTQPSADPDFTASYRTSPGTHERARYTILSETTSEMIHAWLTEHSSAGRTEHAAPQR